MNSQHPISVALLLPTFNEIDGCEAIFHQIDRSLFDDILIVDGGSTDGTVEFALKNNIRIMSQLRKGLECAVEDAIDTLETDCVIEFSLDGNCLPEQLPDLVKKLKDGYDLVVISRYLPPAKSEDDTFVTAFGNFIFSKMIRLLGKFPVTDALTIYRGFKINIMNFPEFRPCLKGPVFEPLVSAVANLRNLKTCEIPGDEPMRIGGASKMRIFYNGFSILRMIFSLYIKKLTGKAKINPESQHAKTG